MADLEITLSGIDQLERKLARIDLLDVLREPMMRALLRLQSRMATYPPPPPRSKYRRTGSYGRKWTHRLEASRNELRGVVGNNIMYGPYVGSEQFQARIHQRRWETDRGALEAERNAIINDFQVTINNALEDL